MGQNKDPVSMTAKTEAEYGFRVHGGVFRVHGVNQTQDCGATVFRRVEWCAMWLPMCVQYVSLWMWVHVQVSECDLAVPQTCNCGEPSSSCTCILAPPSSEVESPVSAVATGVVPAGVAGGDGVPSRGVNADGASRYGVALEYTMPLSLLCP